MERGRERVSCERTKTEDENAKQRERMRGRTNTAWDLGGGEKSVGDENRGKATWEILD